MVKRNYSALFLIAIIILLIVSIFKVVRIQNETITDYLKHGNHGYIVSMSAFENQFKEKKKDEIISTILFYGIPILLLIVIYRFLKLKELESSPEHKLKELYKKSVITKEEFQNKKNEVLTYNKNLKDFKLRKKETDKLKNHLDSLKKNGFLSEEEYQEKMKSIE